MRKLLLLFFCAFMALLDPAMALADAAAAPAATEAAAEAAVRPRLPKASYKRYRGNSRRKRGPFASVKRWGKRQKTKRQLKAVYRAKAAQRKGVITVDRPVRNK